MSALHQTKCFNHFDREAVARCPECRNYFCRECVTEHEGRLICAACLQKDEVPEVGKVQGGGLRKAWMLLADTGRVLIGIFIIWIVFYAVGQVLLLIPDSFHTGDMWRAL